MPDAVSERQHGLEEIKVDATHALIVIAAYGAIFLAASVILSARRDVLE